MTAFIRPFLAVTAIMAFIAALLFSLPNPVSLDDGLRHFAMGQLMAEKGIFGTQGWSEFMYQGQFAHTAMDPWFLSDVLYIPFLSFGPLIGLKLFTLASVLAVILSLWLVIRSLGTSPMLQAILIIALIFGHQSFFFRLMLGRPFPVLTAITLLIIWCLFRRQWIIMAILLAVSVLLSHLFVFPLFVVGMWVLHQAYLGHWRESTLAILASAVGVLVGFLLHPQPWDYLVYVIGAFLPSPFLDSVTTPAELQSAMSGDVITIVAAVMLPAFFLYTRSKHFPWRQALDQKLVYMGILSAVFIAMMGLWLRAVDFFWPVSMVFVACVLVSYPGFLRHLAQEFLPRTHWVSPKIVGRLAVLFVCVSAGMNGYRLFDFNGSNALQQFSAIEEIPTGSRVFNTDWDIIPPLILLRPDLEYATGMDPRLTALKDPEVQKVLELLPTRVFQKYPQMVNAQEWAHMLLAAYPSDYLVLVTDHHKGFIDQLRTASNVSLYAEEGNLTIFAVNAR